MEAGRDAAVGRILTDLALEANAKAEARKNKKNKVELPMLEFRTIPASQRIGDRVSPGEAQGIIDAVLDILPKEARVRGVEAADIPQGDVAPGMVRVGATARAPQSTISRMKDSDSRNTATRTSLIQVALDGPREVVGRTAYHEAFHAATPGLTPAEMKVLTRHFKGDFEAAAEAFGEYAWQRAETNPNRMQAPGPVRRVFARIMNNLAAVGNALRFLGFRTAKDVFRALETGEVSKRMHNWADMPAQAFTTFSEQGYTQDFFREMRIPVHEGTDVTTNPRAHYDPVRDGVFIPKLVPGKTTADYALSELSGVADVVFHKLANRDILLNPPAKGGGNGALARAAHKELAREVQSDAFKQGAISEGFRDFFTDYIAGRSSYEFPNATNWLTHALTKKENAHIRRPLARLQRRMMEAWDQNIKIVGNEGIAGVNYEHARLFSLMGRIANMPPVLRTAAWQNFGAKAGNYALSETAMFESFMREHHGAEASLDAVASVHSARHASSVSAGVVEHGIGELIIGRDGAPVGFAPRKGAAAPEKIMKALEDVGITFEDFGRRMLAERLESEKAEGLNVEWSDNTMRAAIERVDNAFKKGTPERAVVEEQVKNMKEFLNDLVNQQEQLGVLDPVAAEIYRERPFWPATRVGERGGSGHARSGRGKALAHPTDALFGHIQASMDNIMRAQAKHIVARAIESVGGAKLGRRVPIHKMTESQVRAGLRKSTLRRFEAALDEASQMGGDNAAAILRQAVVDSFAPMAGAHGPNTFALRSLTPNEAGKRETMSFEITDPHMASLMYLLEPGAARNLSADWLQTASKWRRGFQNSIVLYPRVLASLYARGHVEAQVTGTKIHRPRPIHRARRPKTEVEKVMALNGEYFIRYSEASNPKPNKGFYAREGDRRYAMLNGMNALGKGYVAVARALERDPRVAEAEAVFAEGASPARVADAARRNIAGDYAARGSFAPLRYVGALTPFLFSSAAGVHTFGRRALRPTMSALFNWKKPPASANKMVLKKSRAAAFKLAYFMSALLMYEMLQRRSPVYQNMTTEEKARGMYLMWPTGNVSMGDIYNPSTPHSKLIGNVDWFRFPSIWGVTAATKSVADGIEYKLGLGGKSKEESLEFLAAITQNFRNWIPMDIEPLGAMQIFEQSMNFNMDTGGRIDRDPKGDAQAGTGRRKLDTAIGRSIGVDPARISHGFQAAGTTINKLMDYADSAYRWLFDNSGRPIRWRKPKYSSGNRVKLYDGLEKASGYNSTIAALIYQGRVDDAVKLVNDKDRRVLKPLYRAYASVLRGIRSIDRVAVMADETQKDDLWLDTQENRLDKLQGMAWDAMSGFVDEYGLKIPVPLQRKRDKIAELKENGDLDTARGLQYHIIQDLSTHSENVLLGKAIPILEHERTKNRSTTAQEK